MKKKLIEVALPLDAISKASAREKSIRHGHPSTLHIWWARRPLAAARAVIFAQMVDDPSSYPDLFPTEKIQEKERQRLFRIIEDLVLWENTTNEEVLQRAREEIWQSWRRACAENADHPRAKELFDRNRLPVFHDPFAGGGALPLEAQRLGLEAFASDLNPVAVLINKAMIEIPPKFAGKAPLNPEAREDKELFQKEWRGARGLAEDVRYYGRWMRDEAENRIGHLYSQLEVTDEMVNDPDNPRPDLKPYLGTKLTVIAWLWARTVKSPNPAFSEVAVPLISTFMLNAKSGKEVYVDPIIEGKTYRFNVHVGKPTDVNVTNMGTTAGKRRAFKCLMSGVPITYDHIREEGKSGRMKSRLMAIVAEGEKGRIYLPPIPEHEVIARNIIPEWKPDIALPNNTRDFKTPNYGLTTFGDLFTPRQLVVLTTFSELVQEAIAKVNQAAIEAGIHNNGKGLANGGLGATAYAEAVGVYLGFGVDKLSDRHSTLTRWDPTPTASGIINTFSRQALPMSWDYSEGNPFSKASGNFDGGIGWIAKVIEQSLPASTSGVASTVDASVQDLSEGAVVSTDPPYYDNIGYADLSDFFYVWLRHSLKPVFPDLFATLSVPKIEELVASPYRHGGKEKAEKFFLEGMTKAMTRLVEQAHPAFPVTIYYAFKQSETKSESGTASTGWETFLDAVIRAGFSITGTWPVRTELSNRMIGSGTNVLASSIVLVCRPVSVSASTVTRRDFINDLKMELPQALQHLQRGNIAPVDLAQAIIGPGMAVYTRFSKVLDAEGKHMTVRAALTLINQVLDELLADQEGDFDADTRWALAWFDQAGFAEGEYGVAETLSKAKNISVAGLVEAGILRSGRSKVRLLKPDELPMDWNPDEDKRLTVWDMVHHLIRVLEIGGERAAAELFVKLGSKAETARELCYRLYTICEHKKWAQEALSYNTLVQSWPEISRLAREGRKTVAGQTELFEEG